MAIFNGVKSVLNIKSLAGKKALVRVDFNLPLKNNRVQDDFRVKKTLPLIRALLNKKAKVILISHLENNGEIISLRSLADYLKKNYFKNLKFVPDLFGQRTKKAILAMKNGEVIILENLRMKAGEKGNNQKFSRRLASLADVYINEAFSVSHRKHASIVGLPKFLPAYAGPLPGAFEQQRELRRPKHGRRLSQHARETRCRECEQLHLFPRPPEPDAQQR